MAYVKKKWNGYKKKAPVIRVGRKPLTTPSAQQIAILDHISESSNHLVVIARAGCAKTTTIIEAMYNIPSEKSVVFLAFNNRIAREAESKAPQDHLVKTHHAFGLMALRKAVGNVEIDQDKDMRIISSLVGNDKEQTELRFSLCQALSLSKSYMAETAEDIANVLDLHDVEVIGDKPEFISNVIKALDLSAWEKHIDPATGEVVMQIAKRISFDDMYWLPLKHNLAIPKYDFVFCDEAQDCSAARIELMMRACKDGGKIVAVGDNRQAIFGFAGAMADSLDNIIARTNADTLTLTKTFRCGKKIVELAAEIVSDYEAGPNNPDGEVSNTGEVSMLKDVQPGDFVLSRLNAPLVPLCMALLKEKRRAIIQGKDIGRGLLWMLKQAKTESVSEFLIWLGKWKETQCERLIAANKDCANVIDKYEVLFNLCEGEEDMFAVRRNIEVLFDDADDDNSVVVFSTVHKAKGLERNRVFMLSKTFKRGKGQEEDNIYYVAMTRAKSSLFFVSPAAKTEQLPALE